MNDAWFTRTTKNIGLIAVSLVVGLTFALALEVGYPIRTGDQPQWCSSIGPLCLAYEWQTLLGSVVAVAAAFLTIREARKQYLLTRWIEWKKVAEDYAVMLGVFRSLNLTITNGRTAIAALEKMAENQVVRPGQIPRIELEISSNIRKEFCPEFFDIYTRLSKDTFDLSKDIIEKNAMGAGVVLKQIKDQVATMEVLKEYAEKTVRQGRRFVEMGNKIFPKDLHLSLGSNLDELLPERVPATLARPTSGRQP
ncbi:hypothetical protein IWQ51_006257 [Labrenzia sp. EL_142]|nr:hypothetical protein [Labrenzia sp. EL_142]